MKSLKNMETKPNILIVDDNTELCTNMRDILEENDYTVECANNGKNAIALSQKNTYDIALVDIKLPDISGIEVVREIVKTSPSTEYIYIIGHATVDSAIEAVKQEHIVSYETKPLEINRIISIIKQIFKRKNVEKTLKESEKKYRELTENMNEIVYIADPETYAATYINHAVKKTYGYTREEWLTDNTLWAKTIHPDDYERVISQVKEAQKYGKDIVLFYKIVVKDGETKWVEDRVFWQKDEEGNIVGINGILLDISERKWMEEVREHLLTRLNNKNKELELFAHTVSHDIRSPLVNIQGYSKELEHALNEVCSVLNSSDSITEARRKLAPTLEDIPESLKYILTSTSKINLLLSSLLHVSRLGKTELTIKQLNMDKLLADVAGTFKHKIKEMGATLKIAPLPMCKGDAIQINQVFSNLMENALKNLDPNRQGIISIFGRKENEQIIYCVEDNGIGIPADRQDEIFEIFRHLNPDDSVGKGLGLTIIRRILDRQEGTIWVESKPGKGSKFFVSLPG